VVVLWRCCEGVVELLRRCYGGVVEVLWMHGAHRPLRLATWGCDDDADDDDDDADDDDAAAAASTRRDGVDRAACACTVAKCPLDLSSVPVALRVLSSQSLVSLRAAEMRVPTKGWRCTLSLYRSAL
jgi:hypothetical protein